MKKKSLIIPIVVIFAIVMAFAWFSLKGKISKEANAIVISNIDLSNIEDGSHIGVCESTLVKAKVQVGVVDNRIQEIEILEHDNGLGKDAEKITDSVLDQQGLDVDLVSGATVSSKVILKAIENALGSK